jgi:RIO kinase 3
MFNLQRLQRYGIPCPTPLLLKKHVLFLSFIGKDTVPAQRLRDVILSPEELANAYKQCLNVSLQFIIEFDYRRTHFSFFSYSNEFIMNVN